MRDWKQNNTAAVSCHLAKVPEAPVKYCRHPSGPPFSSPHWYWVTLISHDLEVDPVPPRVKRALLHWSLASRITLNNNCELHNRNIRAKLGKSGCLTTTTTMCHKLSEAEVVRYILKKTRLEPI